MPARMAGNGAGEPLDKGMFRALDFCSRKTKKQNEKFWDTWIRNAFFNVYILSDFVTWEPQISHTHPSLQVPGSTEIQCYCPATGQLLGAVNPTTPDGIDRAVVRAKNAQVAWAKTTFAERRKVLKTMLK